jgi:hypothetical protein
VLFRARAEDRKRAAREIKEIKASAEAQVSNILLYPQRLSPHNASHLCFPPFALLLQGLALLSCNAKREESETLLRAAAVAESKFKREILVLKDEKKALGARVAQLEGDMADAMAAVAAARAGEQRCASKPYATLPTLFLCRRRCSFVGTAASCSSGREQPDLPSPHPAPSSRPPLAPPCSCALASCHAFQCF